MKPPRPIPAISQARKVRDSVLRVIVMAWRTNPENRICAMLCGRAAEKSPHHIIPRSVRPDLVCVSENFLGLCWSCHMWIDKNRELAYRVGLLGHSWEKLKDINERRRAYFENLRNRAK